MKVCRSARPIRNYALLAKTDFNLNSANQLAISYQLRLFEKYESNFRR